MRTRIVLTALVAVAALSLLGGVAYALRSLEFSPSAFELLGERISIEEGVIRVVCDVKVAIRLANGNVAKAEGPIGRATWIVLEQEEGERTERCSEQRARFLPFTSEITYLSFTGTLPAITGINIEFRNMRIVENIGNGMVKCLIRAQILGLQTINAGVLAGFGFGIVRINEVTPMVGRCPRAEMVRIRGGVSLFNPRTVNVSLI